VFVPFFFVASGMQLDVNDLFASLGAVIKMIAFFGLFLIVRGTPALLYRHDLDLRDRVALALTSSTQLPLVLAITTLATGTGHMRPATAAALAGAAVLSTLAFPALGLRLRGDREAERLLAGT
jgi:Kef-type K+ transport system membrane component KefB